MQVIKSFDPSTVASGSIEVGAADPGCKILLYNLSIYAIEIDFENGSTALLHAGEANWWELDGSTPFLLWSQYSKLNISAPSISQITGMLYRQDEKIEGTYPVFVTYQLGIGNTVTTSQGSTLSIQNDGNALTNIVEATPSGDSSSAVILTNTGVLTLGNSTHKGSISSDNGKFTTDSNGNVAIGGTLNVTGIVSLITTLILGKLSLIIGEDSTGVQSNIFGVDASGNTFIQNHKTGDQTAIYDKDGNKLWSFRGSNAQGSLDHADTGSTLNGSTSGTATWFMPFQGAGFKIFMVCLNNFRNGGASAQTIVLPTAFTTNGIYALGDLPGSTLTKSGPAISAKVLTVGSGGAAGSETSQTAINNDTIGFFPGGWDTLSFNSGEALGHNGFFIAIGV